MAEIHMRDFAKNVTFQVKICGLREYRIRIRIATLLIRLGALIMWSDAEFSFEEEDD